MSVYVAPLLTLLFYASTGALFHDGAFIGSETNTKPPEISNISAGPADLLVSLTNATFPSDTTTHQNKVMNSTAFLVKIFDPSPIKRTEKKPSTDVPLMKPIGRNDALVPTPKSHDDITLQPMDQEMEFKTSVVTSSIIPSTTTRNTNIPHELKKNIIDVQQTTLYTHSYQETSQLISSLSTTTQAKTALPGFTTDQGSIRPSDTVIPSSTKGFTSIQPSFTKNIIDVADTTVYKHSPQPISFLTSPTSNSQANTALPGFTPEHGSIRPSDTIIPSTTKGVTRIQPSFTKNIIDVADTTEYYHSPQPISSLSLPTSKSKANRTLPGFTTDQGSTRPSGTIIPSTTKEITSIQSVFTKNIIDVANTAVYTHSHQETPEQMSSSFISTTSIPSSSSMSAQVRCITTARTMQEPTWPTNDMLTTSKEDTTNTTLIPDKTPQTILPLKSKVSDPKPPSMTMTKTSLLLNSNNPGTMLPAIMSSGKTFTATGSWSPETKSAPMPTGIRDTTIPYIVIPQSPAPKRAANSRISANSSSTMETTEEQSSEITDTRPEYTFNPEITVSNSGGKIILRVKLVSSSTTDFAVVMRDLLQQTCLILDQEIPAEDVTVSWVQQKMFLPCVTVMEIGF